MTSWGYLTRWDLATMTNLPHSEAGQNDSNSPNKEKEYLKISYSSLNLADTCLRKFEFNKMYPRRARDPDQFAADCGKAMHAGYQNYLVNESEQQAVWALMQNYPYLYEYGQRTDERSLEACLSTLDEMMYYGKMDEYELMNILRPLTAAERAENESVFQLTGMYNWDPAGIVVPAIEVPFELRLKGLDLPDGRGIAFTGFMDAAMRHKGTGQVRTLDIKTHRRHREDATPKYKFDSQQVPYGIVLEHVQGHAIDDFEVLYLDCFIDLVSPRIHLYPFLKDSTDLQEWLINTVLRVQRIQRAAEMDYFPRTDGGCLAWNRPCFFLDVCTSRDKDDITNWLLMGEAPEHRVDDTPWVIAEIDVFGTGDVA